MILLNTFFHINEIAQEVDQLIANIKINKDHKIYEGHFPEQAVTPGVCMVQIVKEIIESVIKKKISIKNANEIKFLTMILPELNETVNVKIKYNYTEGNHLKTDASIYLNEVVFFKFKGELQFV